MPIIPESYKNQVSTWVDIGQDAYRELVLVALNSNADSDAIRRFLLTVYQGRNGRFDFDEFNQLDYDTFNNCIYVLKMEFALRARFNPPE